MEIFDLAIAYKWKYDIDFVNLIETTFQDAGLSTFVIGVHNNSEVYDRIISKTLHFNFFLDRASDEDESFEPLAKLIQSKKTRIINEYYNIEKSVDKASIQPLMEKHKIVIPKTVILPTYTEEKFPKELNSIVKSFKKPFVIKPSYYSGGGEGVKIDGKTIEDIQTERIWNEEDRYLIQEFIVPKMINGKRAWFRPLYAFGKVIILLWDDKTHVYSDITKSDERKFDKKKIISITKKLAEISGLDYFSTEIAIDKSNQYYVIDYINDQCDMRMKSEHYDGVPDETVKEFILNMREFVEKNK